MAQHDFCEVFISRDMGRRFWDSGPADNKVNTGLVHDTTKNRYYEWSACYRPVGAIAPNFLYFI